MGVSAQLKILVADDFNSIRQILKNTLNQIGFKNITDAHDGEDAWSKLKAASSSEDPFKLAFLDISMPGMTGIEVLKSIKSDPNMKELRVLIVSAESDRATIVEINKLGADSYILKPFTAQTVLSKLKLLFD